MDQQEAPLSLLSLSDEEEKAVAAICKAAGYSDSKLADRFKTENGNVVEINLSYSCCLHSLPPEISLLSHLKCIDLSWCSKIKTLPREICKLEKLNRLSLSCCEGLEELPREIGDLQGLTCLSLYACTKLKSLPPSIGKLTNLTGLYLSNCEEITRLPGTIAALKNIENLSLNNCRKLEEIPPEMGEMTSLSCLNFSNCRRLVTLPVELSNLTKLSKLSMYLCKELRFIPPEILQLPELQQLVISGCTSLELSPEEIGRYSYSLEEVIADGDHPEIEYYMKLNKGGRRLLRENENYVPDGLWADVLGKANDLDCLYYFIQAKPHLLTTSTNANAQEQSPSTERRVCSKRGKNASWRPKKDPSTHTKRRPPRWLSWKRSRNNK